MPSTSRLASNIATRADYSNRRGPRFPRVDRGTTLVRNGDPIRAAHAIIAAAESESPPLHLLLGRDSVLHTRAKLDALRRDIDGWESTSNGADFPDVTPDDELPATLR